MNQTSKNSIVILIWNLFCQMNAILCFKTLEEGDQENCSCGDELRIRLNDFHGALMNHVSLKALQEPEVVEVSNLGTGLVVKLGRLWIFELGPFFLKEENPDALKNGPIKKLYNLINAVKELEEEKAPEPEPEKKTPEGLFISWLVS